MKSNRGYCLEIHDPEVFMRYLKRQSKWAREQQFDRPVTVEDRTKPWGTGHAILCCKDKVHENFAIINSDDFYGRDAYRVIAEFLKNNHDESKYAMAGYMVKNTLTENGSVKRGVCQAKDNYLTDLVESSIENRDGKLIATALEDGHEFEVSPEDTVSMNMFGFTPKLFKCLEEGFPKFLDGHKDDMTKCEYLIPTIVFGQIERGEASVEVLKTDAVWQGITYREDKDKVVKEIKALVGAGIYPQGLWK